MRPGNFCVSAACLSAVQVPGLPVYPRGWKLHANMLAKKTYTEGRSKVTDLCSVHV